MLYVRLFIFALAIFKLANADDYDYDELVSEEPIQETLEHGIIDVMGGDDSCEGKFRITGQRGRGMNFEKSWIHGSVYKKRLRRTISITYVKVKEGTCCWKIQDQSGNFHEFSRGQEGIPRISRVKRVSAYDC